MSNVLDVQHALQMKGDCFIRLPRIRKDMVEAVLKALKEFADSLLFSKQHLILHESSFLK